MYTYIYGQTTIVHQHGKAMREGNIMEHPELNHLLGWRRLTLSWFSYPGVLAHMIDATEGIGGSGMLAFLELARIHDWYYQYKRQHPWLSHFVFLRKQSEIFEARKKNIPKNTHRIFRCTWQHSSRQRNRCHCLHLKGCNDLCSITGIHLRGEVR